MVNSPTSGVYLAPALTDVHSEHQQRTAEQDGGVTVSSAQPSI